MENEQILMRLEDLADRIIPADLVGGWPPPERLAYNPATDLFTHGDGLTVHAASSYVFYEKISQSALTEEQAEECDYVMRGAEYKRMEA